MSDLCLRVCAFVLAALTLIALAFMCVHVENRSMDAFIESSLSESSD